MNKIIQIACGSGINPLYGLTDFGEVYRYMGESWIEQMNCRIEPLVEVTEEELMKGGNLK